MRNAQRCYLRSVGSSSCTSKSGTARCIYRRRGCLHSLWHTHLISFSFEFKCSRLKATRITLFSWIAMRCTVPLVTAEACTSTRALTLPPTLRDSLHSRLRLCHLLSFLTRHFSTTSFFCTHSFLLCVIVLRL